jgi:hypothetical protein
LIWIDELEQCLRKTRQIPCGDVRLVGIGITAQLVNGAIDGRRIIGIHESARAIVDGVSQNRHVVGVHHTVYESNLHPPGDERRLRVTNRNEERAVPLPIVGDRGEKAFDHVVRQRPHCC